MHTHANSQVAEHAIGLPLDQQCVNRHGTLTPIGMQFRPHLTTAPLVVAEAVAAQRSGAA